MDRRSWLWRRKSSDKTPGETESSGSLSSQSERYSDEQVTQAQNPPSPEVTSKAVTLDEEASATVKALTDKLSAALLNLSAKEDLVKQHAKVAEEAVTGWEKAEGEVQALKQQLDAAGRKNSVLEDRVGQLDGALKECLRQLRQAKEEQGQKIEDVTNEKKREWEMEKSELESQLSNLRTQLQSARNETASVYHDVNPKLEALGKENSALKVELLSRLEELELRTIERDLSTQAAETASKQHLESIKKVTKLEAECQRLKTVIRKSSSLNGRNSFLNSSNTFEYLTDDGSSERQNVFRNYANNASNSEPRHTDSLATRESAEYLQSRYNTSAGHSLRAHVEEIDLMNDFLEMEQLASLTDADVGNTAGKGSGSRNSDEVLLKKEIQALIQRTSHLEEQLETAETEKLKTEMSLAESERKVEALQRRLEETSAKLSDSEKLKADNEELAKSLRRYRNELDISKKQAKKAEERYEELEKIKAEKLEMEKSLTASVKQIEVYKKGLKDAERRLEEYQTLLGLATNDKHAAERDVKDSVVKRELAESRLRDVEAEVKSLLSKIVSLEEENDRERISSAIHLAVCEELQGEIVKLKDELELQGQVGLQHLYSIDTDFNTKKLQEKELASAASKFEECKRTIASLDQQLKCLATLEDFSYESEESMDENTKALPLSTGRWKR